MALRSRAIETHRIVEPSSISERIEALDRRLADGYQRIDVARAQGQDVTAWEDFWLQLLGEYQDVCNRLHVEPLAA